MRAIIVGSGVAGPVTAMALKLAGIEAELFEAHSHSDAEVGSYFTVSPNGLNALDVVGALSLAVEVGFPTRQTIMQNSAQQVLGRIPLGAPLQDGTPALTMKRPRLARALADEAVRRGIPIHYGQRLVSAETTPDSVVATFEGREEPVITDLLIGADGVHSVTRRLIDPAAPQGRYVGLTNFGGVTMAEQVTTDLEPEVDLHLRSPGLLRRPADTAGRRGLVRQRSARRDLSI